MIRLLMLSLSLSLSLVFAPVSAADERALHEVTTLCETYLPHMRTVIAAVKAGDTLTDGQNAVWRVWNRDCKHPSWQQALAHGLPPIAADQTFTSRDPAPRPKRTWRHDMVDILGALERGLTAPMYVCTTRGNSTLCGPR